MTCISKANYVLIDFTRLWRFSSAELEQPYSHMVLVPLKWLRANAGGAGSSCSASVDTVKISYTHPTLNGALQVVVFTGIFAWTGCCVWFHVSSQDKELLDNSRNPWTSNMGNWSNAKRHWGTTLAVISASGDSDRCGRCYIFSFQAAFRSSYESIRVQLP